MSNFFNSEQARRHYQLNVYCDLSESSKLYRDICFRPDITLIMGDDTFIGDGCWVLVPKLIMMEGSQINAGVILAGKDVVILEKNVVVSYGCTFITTTDTPKGLYMNDATPERMRHIKSGRIIIREGSFIGANVIIMPNVTIGKQSVIGAGAYIDRSFEDWAVVFPKQELTVKDRRNYWAN